MNQKTIKNQKRKKNKKNKYQIKLLRHQIQAFIFAQIRKVNKVLKLENPKLSKKLLKKTKKKKLLAKKMKISQDSIKNSISHLETWITCMIR